MNVPLEPHHKNNHHDSPFLKCSSLRRLRNSGVSPPHWRGRWKGREDHLWRWTQASGKSNVTTEQKMVLLLNMRL